jgi:hypothetical protein
MLNTNQAVGVSVAQTNQPTCVYCHKAGHDVRDCFALRRIYRQQDRVNQNKQHDSNSNNSHTNQAFHNNKRRSYNQPTSNNYNRNDRVYSDHGYSHGYSGQYSQPQ